jgi:hypothetical protein
VDPAGVKLGERPGEMPGERPGERPAGETPGEDLLHKPHGPVASKQAVHLGKTGGTICVFKMYSFERF